jgi:hypothetical protein
MVLAVRSVHGLRDDPTMFEVEKRPYGPVVPSIEPAPAQQMGSMWTVEKGNGRRARNVPAAIHDERAGMAHDETFDVDQRFGGLRRQLLELSRSEIQGLVEDACYQSRQETFRERNAVHAARQQQTKAAVLHEREIGRMERDIAVQQSRFELRAQVRLATVAVAKEEAERSKAERECSLRQEAERDAIEARRTQLEAEKELRERARLQAEAERETTREREAMAAELQWMKKRLFDQSVAEESRKANLAAARIQSRFRLQAQTKHRARGETEQRQQHLEHLATVLLQTVSRCWLAQVSYIVQRRESREAASAKQDACKLAEDAAQDDQLNWRQVKKRPIWARRPEDTTADSPNPKWFEAALRRNSAAATIAATWRRWVLWRQETAAALVLQSLARRFGEALSRAAEIQATLTIAAAWRGRQTRQQLWGVHRAIVTIQASIRGRILLDS